MRFLVTGATGFVGGAIVRRLRAEGDDVRALVRTGTDAAAVEALGADVRRGEVGDPNEVAEAARGCEVVVHAAAVASHRAAPRALDWVNVAGTENVLNAARHVGVTRVVTISCADVSLRDEDRVHLGEETYSTRAPFDAHARSKQLAESVALAACDGGLEVVALRPAWLWGPGDRTNLPWIVRWAGARGLALPGGGDNLFATTHVDLLAEAALNASEVEAAPGRAYHVSDNAFVTAREFFRGLSDAIGLPPPRSGLPYPLALARSLVARAAGSDAPWPTDVVRLGRSSQLDIQRSVDDLHLDPPGTLDAGLREVAAWAAEIGGPEAIARLGRRPPDARAVDVQVAAAGG